ncbi:MAG: hypothetical protein AB8G86_16090 [Saprospiraceae bacterium]
MKITEKLPRGLVIASTIAIFLILGLLPFLAWLLEYKDTISAPLTITTEVTPVDIYARTTGEIKLLVSNDALVQKGASLAIIRNTAVYEDVALLKAKLAVKDRNVIDIAKDLCAAQTLSVGELRPALIQIDKAVEAYQTFLRTDNHRALIASRNTQIEQYKSRKNLLKKKFEILARDRAFEQKNITRKEKLLADSVIATIELEEANRKIVVQDLANLKNETDLNALDLNIETLKRETEEVTGQFSLDKLTYTNAIKEALRRLNNDLTTWELQYLLKANVTGRCVYKEYFNDYQFVRKDEKIFSLIPSQKTPYFALLQLPIKGAGKVKTNQEVYVKLNNYPFMEFGVLKGKIKDISALPFDNHYNVQVNFPPKLITTYGDTLQPHPLMHGVGEVIVERKSLYGRISEQVKSVRLNR